MNPNDLEVLDGMCEVIEEPDVVVIDEAPFCPAIMAVIDHDCLMSYLGMVKE